MIMDSKRTMTRTALTRGRRLFGRWRRDSRGASMITTAVTLPLLIVLLMGFYYLYLILVQKQALRQRHIHIPRLI